MSKSSIEWTEQTWNPIVGCSILSPGCIKCYAMKMAARIEAMNEGLPAGHRHGGEYIGTTRKVNGKAVWTGILRLAGRDKLFAPLRRTKPTTYFVNSMGDLFHEDAPDEWRDQVFAVIALAQHHRYQILTKRSAVMRRYMNDSGTARRIYVTACDIFNLMQPKGIVLIADPAHEAIAPPGRRVLLGAWPLPNVWLGVSTEDQRRADERIPDLLNTPAAVRFISAEPLLGPLDLAGGAVTEIGHINWLRGYDGSDPIIPRLDWVIAGGESGPDARPMSRLWPRELRDQCAAASVPFFFKQWGAWKPAGIRPSGEPGRFAFGDYEHDRKAMIQVDSYPRQFTIFGARSVMENVGKAKAGRLLDGIEHNGMPEAAR